MTDNIHDFPGTKKNKGHLDPLQLVSPASWVDEPPKREWMIEGSFIKRSIGLLYGEGGLGKSLLVQQLLTAASLGQPWLGLKTTASPVRCLGIFCEDPEDELRRRQWDINRHYGVNSGDLENFDIMPRIGLDNVLCSFDRYDNPVWNGLFNQISSFILQNGYQIVAFDTVSDFFGGNENWRLQVKRFCTKFIQLSVRMDGLVLFPAHPSRSGQADGSGQSGSTAWHASSRGRAYLTRPKQLVENEDEGDDNERILKTMKNNYGPGRGKIALRYEDGVFVRSDLQFAAMDPVEILRLENDLIACLRALIREGARVASDPRSSKSLVTLAQHEPRFKHVPRGVTTAAIQHLVDQGRLVRTEMGPQSRRYLYLRPPDLLYPGENSSAGDGKLL